MQELASKMRKICTLGEMLIPKTIQDQLLRRVGRLLEIVASKKVKAEPIASCAPGSDGDCWRHRRKGQEAPGLLAAADKNGVAAAATRTRLIHAGG